MFVRWLLLAVIFSVELLLIPAVLGREGLVRQLGTVGPTILRAVLGFAALFTTFAWLKFRPALTSTSVELSEFKVDRRFLSAHIFFIILFAFLSSSLGRSISSSQYSQSSNGFLFAWFAAGICSIGFGAIAAIPLAFWRRILRDTGYLCIGSFSAASLGAMVGMAGQSLWPVAAAATFWLSKAALKPLIPDLIVDPANLVVGTARFAIEVAPECSGLESVGLVISFALAWLVIFRKECRVYRALLLIPIGVGVTFLLNALRIAALVLIGNAGHEQVAMRGFHSQAGWIILNFVALGFAVSARRIPWIANIKAGTLPSAASVPASENPTIPWLLPFVMILAAGIAAAAVTAEFEWLYPLRFIAAAVALTVLRRGYRDLPWKVSWLAPIAGIAVFLIWIALDRTAPATAEVMPAALVAASPLARSFWLTIRVLSAVVTVPIAEELAFRGFLYRRLVSPAFEVVSFQRFSWLALIGSSIVFGLLHGDRWLVGSLAGAIYALVLLRRGSLGDAVAAHAVTNALLAIDVLAFHHWHLW